jgi:hypothetical protein
MPGIRYVISIEAAPLTTAQVLSQHVDRSKTCRALTNLINGIGSGTYRSGRVEIQNGDGVAAAAVAASGTVTYSGSTGAQSITIGGVVVSFTAGASDAATVQNAITAIRASPAAFGLVFIPTAPVYGAAINTGAVLTLWANTIPTANTLGNSLSLACTGTGATASGASFAGGVNSTPNGFCL